MGFETTDINLLGEYGSRSISDNILSECLGIQRWEEIRTSGDESTMGHVGFKSRLEPEQRSQI